LNCRSVTHALVNLFTEYSASVMFATAVDLMIESVLVLTTHLPNYRIVPVNAIVDNVVTAVTSYTLKRGY